LRHKNNKKGLMFSHEVIVLLSFDLGVEPNLDDLQGFLNSKEYVGKANLQELYVDYVLWERNRPLYITLNPVTLTSKYGTLFDLRIDMRVYPSGACSLRYRAKSKKGLASTDEVIETIRALCFKRNRNKIIMSSKKTLQEFTDEMISDIQDHVEKTSQGSAKEFSRLEVARGYKMRYVIICIHDIKPRLGREQLLQSPHAEQIAGLVSWNREWRNFPSNYIDEYLASDPLPTKYKNSLVLVKFPATLLYLPNAPESAWDLYSIIIEHCRIGALFYRVYSKLLAQISSKVIEILNGITSLTKDEISHELLVSLNDTIWRLNRIKIEFNRSFMSVRRTREMIPLHRLLFVYDRLHEVTKVDKERISAEDEINFLDSSIKDALSLLSTEWNRRREEVSKRWTSRVELLATILAVFTFGEIFSNICSMYFDDLSSLPFLGRLWPALLPWIVSALVAIIIYKLIKQKP